MRQVLVRQGEILVHQVPDPEVEPGTVLVRVVNSCISVGTEMSGVKASGVPLWRRALAQPAKIRRVAEMVAAQGLGRTLDFVKGTVGAELPMGYSASGTIVEVGAGIDDLAPGMRVACAGAQCAFHAELIRVPRNLCVPMPETLDFGPAASVTLGAIALQGLRRLAPTLGETFVVLGLGLLGQLTVQMLKAGGCRVIGLDLDPRRVETALVLGLDVAPSEDGGAVETQVALLTAGVGADGVVVTASSTSPDLLAQAFRMCRKKGRVVLVGDVPMVIDRADIYAKELDFLISTSYGPGRYDRRYEEEGADYPVAYVRWTENRNMAAYLDLLAQNRVRVEPLIGARHPLDEAPAAYAALKGGNKPLMVLLDYPRDERPPLRRAVNSASVPIRTGALGVAVVGGGAFAKAVHLPNLKALGDKVSLRAVVSRTGHSALTLARQFGAGYSATRLEDALDDPQVDAVLIATRHDSHGSMVLSALRAGKHVFVEKPLALTAAEIAGIKDFLAANPDGPVLVTGFNRRFSPFALRLGEILAKRRAPLAVTYRMNAGRLPHDHWVHGPEGGGRNRGEACHIYDLFTALTGSACVSTQVTALEPGEGIYRRDDNFSAGFTFEDGSIATLLYTALGSADHPKERMEVFSDGRVLALDDYKALSVQGAKVGGLTLPVPDKGHAACLAAFVEAASGRAPPPIPLWQQIQATEMALAVEAVLHPEAGRE